MYTECHVLSALTNRWISCSLFQRLHNYFKRKPFSHVVASLQDDPQWSLPSGIHSAYGPLTACTRISLHNYKDMLAVVMCYVRGFCLALSFLFWWRPVAMLQGCSRGPAERSMRPGAEAFFIHFISFLLQILILKSSPWYNSKNSHLLIIIPVKYLLPLYIFENCPQHIKFSLKFQCLS